MSQRVDRVGYNLMGASSALSVLSHFRICSCPSFLVDRLFKTSRSTGFNEGPSSLSCGDPFMKFFSRELALGQLGLLWIRPRSSLSD